MRISCKSHPSWGGYRLLLCRDFNFQWQNSFEVLLSLKQTESVEDLIESWWGMEKIMVWCMEVFIMKYGSLSITRGSWFELNLEQPSGTISLCKRILVSIKNVVSMRKTLVSCLIFEKLLFQGWSSIPMIMFCWLKWVIELSKSCY